MSSLGISLISYYTASIVSGLISLFILIQLLTKYDRQLFKKYVYLFASISAVVIGLFTQVLTTINKIDSQSDIDISLMSFTLLGLGTLIYTIPSFIHELVEDEQARGKNKLFFSIAILSIALNSIPYQRILEKELVAIINIMTITMLVLIFLAVTGYTLWESSIDSEENKNDRTKSIYKAVRLVAPILCIGIFIDLLKPLFLTKASIGIVFFSVTPAIYLLWNALFIRFSIRFVAATPKPDSGNELNSEQCIKYRITNREKDVLTVLFQGLSNQEIADQLFISSATVKTHIHNIYQKTDSKNRVELMQLLR